MLRIGRNSFYTSLRRLSTLSDTFRTSFQEKNYSKAFEIVSEPAKSGNIEAQRLLGEFYLNLPQNKQNIISLIDLQGKPTGGSNSARDVIDMINLQRKQNLQKFLGRKRKSSSSKSKRKDNDDEVNEKINWTRDVENGLKWLEIASDLGDLKAQYLFSSETLNSSSSSSLEKLNKSIHFLNDLTKCKVDELEISSQLSLGFIFYEGHEKLKIQKGFQKAFDLFEKIKHKNLIAKFMTSQIIISKLINLKNESERKTAVSDLIHVALQKEECLMANVFLFNFISQTLNSLHEEDDEQMEKEENSSGGGGAEEEILNDLENIFLGFKEENICFNDEISLMQKCNELLDEAVNDNEPEACLIKAEILLEQSNRKEMTKESLERVIKLYQIAGEGGIANGYLCSGALYYSQKEFIKAFKDYEKAAVLGSLEAYKNLASMYFLGDGVMKCEETGQILTNFIAKQQNKQ